MFEYIKIWLNYKNIRIIIDILSKKIEFYYKGGILMVNRMFNTADFLKRALDGASLRHTAISNNIANVNTPGYKRVTVEFENLLKDELEKNKLRLFTTNSKHMRGSKDSKLDSVIEEHKNIAVRRDGNGVNIDIEVAERAKNEIYYNAISRQVSRKFEAISSVINEGGR